MNTGLGSWSLPSPRDGPGSRLQTPLKHPKALKDELQMQTLQLRLFRFCSRAFLSHHGHIYSRKFVQPKEAERCRGRRGELALAARTALPRLADRAAGGLRAGKAGQGAPAQSSSSSPTDNLSHSQFYRQSCSQFTCKLSPGQPIPAAVEQDR